jgi:hypothetical protein
MNFINFYFVCAGIILYACFKCLINLVCESAERSHCGRTFSVDEKPKTACDRIKIAFDPEARRKEGDRLAMAKQDEWMGKLLQRTRTGKQHWKLRD